MTNVKIHGLKIKYINGESWVRLSEIAGVNITDKSIVLTNGGCYSHVCDEDLEKAISFFREPDPWMGD